MIAGKSHTDNVRSGLAGEVEKEDPAQEDDVRSTGGAGVRVSDEEEEEEEEVPFYFRWKGSVCCDGWCWQTNLTRGPA